MTRTHQATGEALLVPWRKNHGAENCITGDTGKAVDGERVAEGPAVAVKRGNARGAKRPCCCARTPTRRKARVNDKNTHQFARPEEEDIRQGEGRTYLALLWAIRSRLQAGNAPGSLPDGQEQQRRTWDRWSHV